MTTARKHSIRAAALCVAIFLALTLYALPSAAAPPGPLKLPNFDALSGKARQSVAVTLDSTLLSLAAGFLDPARPDDAAAKEIIRGLTGIYVRSYSFDSDFVYPRGDVEALRKQLSTPGWQHVVEVRNKGDQENVDVYVSVEQGRANGLVVIASAPREFTIVNIVGAVDLQKLQRLGGRFGIPKLAVEKTR
jgi:uncharacterized protein DUF4252